MAKNILIVQSRSDMFAKFTQKAFRSNFPHYASRFVFQNAYTHPDQVRDAAKNLHLYSCVIFGGSGDVGFVKQYPGYYSPKVINCLKNIQLSIISSGTPSLGICLGHQLLGLVLHQKIVTDPSQKQFGWSRVNLTPEGKKDPIFSQLPYSFDVYQSHSQSVAKLPQHCTLLATNDICPIQAIRHKESTYSVQFHPELTAQQHVEFAHLYRQIMPEREYGQHHFDPHKCKTKISSRVIHQFFKQFS